MAITVQSASTPVFVHMLGNLSAILQKARDAVAAGQQVEAELVEGKLAPDMFGLARQVQIACDMAKLGMAKLSGQEAPSFPDEETTLEQLQQRIAKTVDYMKGLDAKALDGVDERTIELKLRNGMELTFNGESFLMMFIMPNFYFHVTTAYDILRARGMPLEKKDFLGGA